MTTTYFNVQGRSLVVLLETTPCWHANIFINHAALAKCGDI